MSLTIAGLSERKDTITKGVFQTINGFQDRYMLTGASKYVEQLVTRELWFKGLAKIDFYYNESTQMIETMAHQTVVQKIDTRYHYLPGFYKLKFSQQRELVNFIRSTKTN